MSSAGFADAFNDYFKQYPKLRYKKGETIRRPDRTMDSTYYLTEGYVRQYTINERGDEFTVFVHRPHFVFTVAMIIAESADHYMEAMSDAVVYAAPRDETMKFLNSDSRLTFEISFRLLAAMDLVQVRMESFALGTARQRLATCLLIMFHNCGVKRGDELVCDLELTQQDWGRMTGLSRETVNVEMSRFKREGLLVGGKRLAMRDLRRLEETSGSSDLIKRLGMFVSSERRDFFEKEMAK